MIQCYGMCGRYELTVPGLGAVLGLGREDRLQAY